MERHCFPTNFVMNLKGARESTSVRPVFLCRPMKRGRKGGNATKGIFYENCSCWHAGEEAAAPEEWEIGGTREGTKGFPFLFCISPPFPLLFSVLFCPSFPDISSGQNGQKRGGGKEGDGWGTEGTDIVIEALALVEKAEKKPWGKEERMEVLTFSLRAALEKCEGQVERMRSRETRTD